MQAASDDFQKTSLRYVTDIRDQHAFYAHPEQCAFANALLGRETGARFQDITIGELDVGTVRPEY
jgi:hypothetical protein